MVPVIVLNPALGQGASTTLQIPISGGAPGTQFCFSATLAGSTGHECCTQEICIQLPECECFESMLEVRDVPGAGNFEFSLNMTNLTPFSGTPFVGEWVTLAVAPGYARNYLVPTGRAVYATADNRRLHRIVLPAEEQRAITKKMSGVEALCTRVLYLIALRSSEFSTSAATLRELRAVRDAARTLGDGVREATRRVEALEARLMQLTPGSTK